MGVDFNAKLFVGVEEQDFDWEGVEPELDSLEDIVDKYYGHKSIPGDLDLEYLRAGNWRNGLIGFTVADSGNYSYREAEIVRSTISLASLTFKRLFLQEAKIFICAEVG